MKPTLSSVCACIVALWAVTATAQDASPSKAVEARGTFGLCRISRSDVDQHDAAYKDLWRQRQADLARLAAGTPLQDLDAAVLSRMDLHAHLREALFDELVDAIIGGAVSQKVADRAEARRLRDQFVRNERPVLEAMVETIERDLVQRPGGRSAAAESRVSELYRVHLEPKLRRLEAGLKPAASGLARRAAAAGGIYVGGFDLVWSFGREAFDLMARMRTADERSRQILQVELYYAPRLAAVRRASDETGRLAALRCQRQASVDSRAALSATDTVVSEGECLRIVPDAASRIVWTRHGGGEVQAGPEGTDPKVAFAAFALGQLPSLLMLERRPLPEVFPGALLWTVLPDDGDGSPLPPLAVGVGGYFRMPADGELVFLVNDAHRANNRGAFVVDFEPAADDRCAP